MTGTQDAVSSVWRDDAPPGVTTASLLVVLAVSTAVGALVGLALSGWIGGGLLAVAAGFFGTVVAGIVRNTLLIKAWGSRGVEDVGTPKTVVVYATLASLAGSLAADRMMQFVGLVPDAVIGAFAGLLSALLMGLLMLAYRMTPEGLTRQSAE